MAEFYLGKMYEHGRGIRQDNIRAYVLFNVAAVWDKCDVAWEPIRGKAGL